MGSGFDALAGLAKQRQDAQPKESFGLTEAVARYLDKRVEEDRSDGFHVSSLYRFCPVQWVLARVMKKPRYDPVKDKFRWEVGHAMHWLLQKQFTEMGCLKGQWRCENGHIPDAITTRPAACAVCGSVRLAYQEMRVSHEVDKGVRIVGRTDGVVELNGEDFGIEIKSEDPAALPGISQPRDYPVYQLNVYMHLLRELGMFPNLRRGIVIHVAPMGKDTVLLPMKSFVIEYSDEPWKKSVELVKSAASLWSAYERGRLTVESLIANRVCGSRDDGRRHYCDYVAEDFGVDAMKAAIGSKRAEAKK